MRWIAILVLMLIPEVALCQDLWTKTNWAELEIICGRVNITALRCGQCRYIVDEAQSDVTQKLSIDVTHDATIIEYESTIGSNTIKLFVDGHILITNEDIDSLETVRFYQPRTGDIEFDVNGIKYKAANIWHLAIAEPKLCQFYLSPLLQKFNSKIDILELASDVKKLLLLNPSVTLRDQYQQWQLWLDQLENGGTFQERQEADNNLRLVGQPLLMFMSNYEFKSSEQRRRVAAILSSIKDGSRDTPDRVATWFADDEIIWRVLLKLEPASKAINDKLVDIEHGHIR